MFFGRKLLRFEIDYHFQKGRFYRNENFELKFFSFVLPKKIVFSKYSNFHLIK